MLPGWWMLAWDAESQEGRALEEDGTVPENGGSSW